MLPRPARLVVAAALFAGPVAIGAAPVTIADLAPLDAIGVVGVDDWSRMMTALRATALDDLLEEPSMQAWLEKMREGDDSPMQGLEERLERADSSLEEIGWPSGMAGAAFWVAADETTGELVPRWIAAADYGDRAEEVEGVLVQIMEDSEGQDEIELDETEIGEVTVRTITVREEGAGEDEGDMESAPERGMMDQALEPTVMHMARVDGVFVLASDMAGLERAVDRLGGDNVESVADAPAFTTAMSQAGEAHLYGALLVQNAFEAVRRVQQKADDAGEPGPFDALPMAPTELWTALGLDAVSSLSFGTRFDADGAITETVGGVAASEKRGLLSLFNLQGANFAPPAFVGADVHSLTTFKIDFGRILPLVQQVVATMPEDARQEVGGMVAMFSAQAAPLLAALGSEVVMTERLERPFGAASQKSLIAIEVRDGATIAATLGQFGIPVRDFEGFQIWEQPGSMMAASSIGLGGGYVFLGDRGAVEGALRTIGRADALKLADEPLFQRAAGRLGGGGMLYSYTELRPSLEYGDWMRENFEAVVRAQLEPMLEGVDPEEAREWVEDSVQGAREEMAWMQDFPRAEVFLRHLGDTVTEGRSTPDGYRFKSRQLPAQ